MEFKNIFKNLRTEKGISQEELAKQLNTTRSSVANWEQGQNFPNDEMKIKIANYFNCSIDYLMGNSNFKTPELELEHLMLNDVSYRTDLYDALIANSLLFTGTALSSKDRDEIQKFLEFNASYDVEDCKIEKFINSFPKKKQIAIENAIKKIIEETKLFKSSKDIYANFKLKKYKREKQFYMCPVYGSISAGQPNWVEECIEGRIPLDPELMGIVEPEEHFFLRVNGNSMNKIIKDGAYALIHKQDIVDNGEIAVVLVDGDEATLKKFSKQNDLVILEPMSNDSSFTTQVYNKDTQIKILGKYIGKFEINK